MECKFCGTNFEGQNCPNCGAPAPAPAPTPASREPNSPPVQETYQKPNPQSTQHPAQRNKGCVGPVIRNIIVAVILVGLLRSITLGMLKSASSSVASSRMSHSVSQAPEHASSSSTMEVVWPPLPTESYLNLSEEEYKEAAIPMDYEDVKRYPEKYIGQDIAMTIRITQVMDSKGETLYIGYVANADGSWPSTSSLNDPGRDQRGGAYRFFEEGSPAIYDGDVVVIYGELLEIRRMETMIGYYDVPVINGRYMEFLE